MGLDVHGVNFVRFAARKRPLGCVATLGRQGLHVTSQRLRILIDSPKELNYGEFCEDFLQSQLGAMRVDSFDYSDFEGARYIVDLNQPLCGDFCYDTVIDAGTMEHVYNVPQGLKTMSEICAPSGQILHISPANNFCNHGFWQFSPELFFSLYSPAHGYRDTQCFLATSEDEDHWFEVNPPPDGHWDYLMTARVTYVMVRTLKTGAFSHDHVQQSRYVNDWQQAPQDPKRTLKQSIKRWLEQTPIFPIARFANRVINDHRAFARHKNLRRVAVSDLLA